VPKGTLAIDTLLTLIKGTKTSEKELGKSTLVKIFAAQTQESADLPPVCPAFPEYLHGQNNSVSLTTLPSPRPGLVGCCGVQGGLDAEHRQADRQTDRCLGSLPARHLLGAFGLAFFMLHFLRLQNGDSIATFQALFSALHPDVALVTSSINQMFLALPQKASHGGICCAFTIPCLVSQIFLRLSSHP